jgi:hypothetical protein
MKNLVSFGFHRTIGWWGIGVFFNVNIKFFFSYVNHLLQILNLDLFLTNHLLKILDPLSLKVENL